MALFTDTGSGIAATTSTAAPTTSDDASRGYGAGRLWLDTATGLQYICRDATVGAASWVVIGIQGAAVPAGADLLPSHFQTGTTSSAFGSAVYGFVPFVVARRQAFSQLAWWQVTASGSGGLCRTALYTSNGGAPDQLIANTDSGTVDVTSGAGVLKAGAFSQTITINPGLYWGFWEYNGTGGSFTVTRFSNSTGINMNFAVTAAPAGGMRYASSATAFSAPLQTAPAVTGSLGDFPVLMLRGA